MRQSSNLIHSLFFAFFNRNSMRLRLFGFPDESPHAIPGPDDFCITRMMRAGLMELRVSGGISLHSPKLVDKTSLRPLTQSTAKLLTQQSWAKQEEKEQCYKGQKNDISGKPKWEKSDEYAFTLTENTENKTGRNKYGASDFSASYPNHRKWF